jgi:hypothetical protein
MERRESYRQVQVVMIKIPDPDKIKWDCVICGRSYRPNIKSHQCEASRLRCFNAGKKGAETRLENDGMWFLRLSFGAALDQCRAMYAGRI